MVLMLTSQQKMAVNVTSQTLTTLLEAAATFLLYEAVAGSGPLAGGAGLGVEATQRDELRPLLLLRQLRCLQQLRARRLPTPKGLWVNQGVNVRMLVQYCIMIHIRVCNMF